MASMTDIFIELTRGKGGRDAPLLCPSSWRSGLVKAGPHRDTLP